MIVNLPGKVIQESNQNYMTHLAGMIYDPILLDSIFQFAIAKKILENKQENNTTEKVEQVVEQSDDVTNLF